MKGIYSDQTYLFMSPEEPVHGDKVTLKIRIPKEYGKICTKVNFSHVKNQKNYKDETMKIVFSDEFYDYYQTEFLMPDRLIKYHFELNFEDKKTIKYDAMGIVKNRAIHDFFIIPDFKTSGKFYGDVYYQIFIDRFSNGDKANDPVNGEYVYDGRPIVKKEWNELPSQDNGHREFYGGDIQGIINKLDYLSELGIDTIYLNPVFVSPSPHKYDTQDYEHIDPHFGKIVDDSENIEERYKVRTTSIKNLMESDLVFAELVNKAHEKGIKIVLDGVFNHCGSYHRWIDEKKLYDDEGVWDNQESSKYRDNFYWHHDGYEGWWGYKTLPKLNYGNIKLWKYIASVGEKWVSEPFNADGWRLDVGDDLGKSFYMNSTFWRYFNKRVKKANNETVVFAEIYKSPLDWITNLSWDSIMNYITCMEPVSSFLTGLEKHSDGYVEGYMDSWKFVERVRWALSQLPMNSRFLALNQLSNHDHSRWITRTNRKVGRIHSLGHDAALYDIDIDIYKLGMIMMFTLPGCPGYYYGDEIGLGGWTDPDNRRTFPWEKLEEEYHQEILKFNKKLIELYKNSKALKKGCFDFIDYKDGYVVYSIWNEDENFIVIINRSEEAKQITLDSVSINSSDNSTFETKLAFNDDMSDYLVKDNLLNIQIPAKSGKILKKK